MIDSFAKHPLAGLFNKLTPELVLDVVEAGGRRCSGRFLILNSYENRVWQFELEDGTWVVGKFYRPGRWNRDALLAEHRFLRELADEEVPVAAPVELTPGETLGQVEGIWSRSSRASAGARRRSWTTSRCASSAGCWDGSTTSAPATTRRRACA
jgi:hypothetical protein